MKKLFAVSIVALVVGALGSAAFAEKSAADLEKEKALANPYAADLGPASIDWKAYPGGKPSGDILKGYNLLIADNKCGGCHSPARPLNHSFAETWGDGKEGRGKTLESLKKTRPELFDDPNIWHVEASIWQRYVKRMMSKPGCQVTKDDGKYIWMFLNHDSKVRRIGTTKEQGAKWKMHREALLKEFKGKHPKRYDELYGKH